VLKINDTAGAPVLNVFGGKITTYRKLAESSLEKIDGVLDKQTAPWTAGVSLPGGDFPVDQVANLQNELAGQLPFLNGFTIRRLIRQYGTQAANIFGEVSSIEDMGVDFGHGIYSREIDWAIKNEWVHNAQDFLWRRSKMGLRFDAGKHEKLEKYITQKLS
jgi:glycerol-3-phosphate dehydrogenase